MKNIIVLSIVVGGSIMATGLWAQPGDQAAVPQADVKQVAAPTEPITKLINVGNTICPVSKEKVDAMQPVQVLYMDKLYNLCCKMCLKDFNKDPEKYIAMIPDLEKQAGASNDVMKLNPVETMPK